MLNLDRKLWRRVRFGDVVTNKNETIKDPAEEGVRRVLGLDNLDGGELEVKRWGDLADGTTFTRRVRPGQTLFGKRRAYQRKTAYATFNAICSGDILVLESADEGVLLPKLLPFLAMTDTFYEHALGTSAGSLSPRTKWADLAKYEFDLPPLDQQRRIADLLWSVESHSRALHAEHRAADALKTSVIEQHVGRTGGPLSPLASTLDIVRGGSPRPINDYFTEEASGLNWIKIGDVPPDGKYITGTAQRILPSGLPRTRQVSPGDLLLSNSMSYGRPYIVKISGCIHDGWLALSDPKQKWRTEYLYYLLRSQGVQASFARAAGGSTVRNLKISAVGDVKVWRPTIPEQDEALAAINAAETVSSAIEEETIAAKSVASTALAKLLGGVA